MGLAKFEIIGRLTRDPEEKKTQNGLTIGKFGVAVNNRTETTFWNIVTFGKTAEFVIKWLKKGSSVRLYGDMKNRKEDGKLYYDFIADDVTFIESKREEKEDFTPIDDEEDMPF